jgi:hypothetical protein
MPVAATYEAIIKELRKRSLRSYRRSTSIGRGADRPRPVGLVSEDFEVGVDGHRVGQDVPNRGGVLHVLAELFQLLLSRIR